MSDLTDRIDAELRQMAPHIRARKTAKLLEEASTALKRRWRLLAKASGCLQGWLGVGHSLREREEDLRDISVGVPPEKFVEATDALIDLIGEADQ